MKPHTRKSQTVIETASGERLTLDDDFGGIQLMSNKLLAAVARGEVDLNLLAKETLIARGFSPEGTWVGHKRSAELLGMEMPSYFGGGR